MTAETHFAQNMEELFAESCFAGAPVDGVYTISEEALNCYLRHVYRAQGQTNPIADPENIYPDPQYDF